jgi:hypothetical protein
VSGSNVSATLGGLTAPASATDAATMNAGTYSQTTDGSAFSFTETFNQGDAIPTGTTVTSGVASSLPAFGSVTTTSGGVAGTLGGSINSAGVMSLTAGGAGTSATGQFVLKLPSDNICLIKEAIGLGLILGALTWGCSGSPSSP